MRDLGSRRALADPTKAFCFRAPPVTVEVLQHLGVDCVTLANNHALDFGAEALLDTFRHLAQGGIAWVDAGADEVAARTYERDGRLIVDLASEGAAP